MSQFALLGRRRFAPFFWTQALGAFNDNAFRNALVMLVAFQMGLDDHTVSLYTNLAPALFIIPFFLFSATAGQLAEKYEKSRIIRYVKLFEIGAMALAAYGFYTHHTTLLLVVLFMMGMHSATFGPIKYAILPQALKPDELVGGNGLVEMGTQMAMLVGMIAGNSLMLVAGVGPLLASGATIAVAMAGYLACRRIPPAPATAPELKFNWNPFSETARVLAITRADRAVFNAVLGISWFWFFGTVLIAQLPIYTRETLGGDGSVNTLVLTLFSIGTGVGALLCERMSGRRVEIGLVPLGAFGLTAFGVDLYFARHGVAPVRGLDWLAFLHGAGSWRVALDLSLIGMFAGFYVVPLFAFVQARAPREKLSRIIAGTNILNALADRAGRGFRTGTGRAGHGCVADLSGGGAAQRAGRLVHLHPGARVRDALHHLGAGEYAVPGARRRHVERARRRAGIAGVQPRQLHGCPAADGEPAPAGAFRHVLQDLQHPGAELRVPHRQGDSDRWLQGRPGRCCSKPTMRSTTRLRQARWSACFPRAA